MHSCVSNCDIRSWSRCVKAVGLRSVRRGVRACGHRSLPAVSFQPEGEDELKKMQLMELAIINGTYRDTKMAMLQARKWCGVTLLTPVSFSAAAAVAAARATDGSAA